ncbi:Undecaprenyl-phosphate N-acetylglucosaminyl 1-phosphate transferase [Indibacter alkaliphilus LW1]|jgi:UDP-GlcNAc:undecaprenyl-phosphate GlcNAc-1-phosphate transferase|uniref:Undecaprenyl-phosphate N-acetylglucosaminyl 1-phosphate transferase n=1 Tax=Indibacter alkaliphilus (strain CCUG 57479 / KCTC 22604 / LW1) TaxID=1189612 RepID=S2D9S9_INDAL|nr:glycosyltransferase family 4 protein [Indibacter alkaliphilus]EOZ95634.1 Undecaprenyl-phosphate N-acetylglucosaminyl 1-phosphate transferase [Indibacter alkaliphilus LW1]
MPIRYLLVFSILTILSLIYYRLAKGLHIVDKPNSRSSHQIPTVRGGGILFPISIVLWWVLMDFQNSLMVSGLVLISGVSFWDDIKGMSRRIRILVQLIAIVLLFADLGLFGDLPIWAFPILLVLTLGILNAVNFMDGINGITGLYALVFLGTVFLLDRVFPSVKESMVLYLGIAVFVFLYYNLRNGRALMFAGDIGSVSFAYMMVYFMLKMFLETGNWTVIILLFVYGVDSIGTLVQRIKRKENIFEPHRKHLYQIMANQMAWPHIIVAFIFAGTQFLINYLFVLRDQRFPESWVMLCLMIAVAALYLLGKRKLEEKFEV